MTHTHDLAPSCVERTLPDGTVLGACVPEPSYGHCFGSAAATVAVDDTLDGMASVVVDLEWYLEQLHAIKRDVPEGAARDALLQAIDKVQTTWAAAAVARTALRDVQL